MPYRKLYRNRQEANGDWRSLSWYVEDAKQLSWVADIRVRATTELPHDGLLGFIVRQHIDPNSLRHPYTILISDGIDQVIPYMERFVVIKELMHCYFECDDGSATDSQIILETHMRQFFGASATTQSSHVQAEYTAFWMAIGVLCPEQRRVHYRNMLQSGDMDVEAISHAARAPIHIVHQLLSDQFEDEIRDILN